MSTTCSGMGDDDAFKNKRFLPGGAAILTFNHWACTVLESVQDEYDCGWWCYTTLQGRNKKLFTTVGFYRSNKASPSTGPTTAHAQAMRSLENEKLRSNNPKKVLVPREEMVRRLEQKIKGWQQRGDSIIFFGDGNETPDECAMTAGVKRHSMAWLFAETGMEDVLRSFHPAPSTTTTTPGRPIDWIGAWKVPILRVGHFAENYPAISDHLGFFVDIDMAGLMGGVYDVMKLPKLRKLTLDNIVAKTAYVSFVLKQWELHKIAERADALHERALLGIFPTTDFALLNALDAQITEILLGAEKRCSKKLVERDKWSPRLQTGARNILYWRARLHSLTDIATFIKGSLERYRRLALISQEEHDSVLSRNAIKQKLREAWQLHRQCQQRAEEWRLQHLQDRADDLANRQNTKQAKAVKSIKNHEKSRQRFGRIRRANGKLKRGLIQIEVQDPVTRDKVMLTEKELVNDALLARNEQHLQEPNFTPFGTLGDMYHLVDPTNPDNQVEELLRGTAVLPASRTDDLEVQQWVTNLQRKRLDELQLSISSEDFVRYFSRKKEGTASSPSDRHFGHMKVIAQMEQSIVRDTIVQVAATALITKQPLDRWLRCTQVMLDKGKGVFINNLRIIQLLEADLNFILGLVWSKRLNQAASADALFNTSQYALPGKTCNSAVLKKVLFFDLLRQTQQAGSIVDFDAKAAYDSIIPALATVTCMRMGLPRFAGDFMTLLINQMEYSVATGLGESTKTYKAGANPFFLCQGGMQGSASAAPIYNIHHDVSLTTYTEHGTPAVFHHPNPAEGHTVDYAAQFVDDNQQQKSMLGLLRHYSTDLAQCTSAEEVDALLIRVTNADANRWCKYSFCAGGMINASKCFWQLIKPTQCPNTGKIIYSTAAECPGEVVLKFPDDEDIQDVIPRYEPSVANRTLGARLAPDGNVHAEIKSRYDKAKQWSVSLRKAQLSNADCWVAYRSCVCSAVSYPLLGQQCTVEDLSKTQGVMDQIACHALGLNEHFPRALLHGPVSLGGIGVPTLWADALADKLAYFMHHMRVCDDVGRQLTVSSAITQLEIGMGTPFFELPFELWVFLATPSWLRHLWQSCSRAGVSVQAAAGKHWIPPLQTESDEYIMDRVRKIFSRKASIKLNHCRRYLQVVTTSDLFLHDGSRIHPDIYRGARASGRKSQYAWPEISPPSRTCWNLWKQFLRYEFPAGTSMHSADEVWCDLDSYSHSLLCRYDTASQTLYRLDGDQWWRHETKPAPSLRGVVAKCCLEGSQHEGQPPATGLWVEIEYTKNAIVVLTESLRTAAAMRRIGGAEAMDIISDPISLAARLRALPIELKRVVGRVTIPDDDGEAIIDALRSGEKVYGVSDGSASNGLAAHGWKLTRRPNDPMAIKGRGPVDGLSPSAFRAEMQGQVAVLIVSSLLVADRGVRNAHILSLCDNQATLRRLAAHSKSLRVRDQVESEVDLFLIYREWMKKRHVRCTRRWVKGHQDRKLPRHEISDEGLMNIEVDELATSAYIMAGVDKTSLEVDVFSEEAYGIIIDGSKVTCKLKHRVVERCGETALLQYLTNKHKLSEGKMEGIDWQALARFLRSLSPQQRATQVKLQHNWIPTNSFLYQQRRIQCDKCPLCKSAVETPSHVRWCRFLAAQRYRQDRLSQLEREFKGINTAPEIVYCWMAQLAAICGERLEDYSDSIITGTPIKQALGEARRHQAVLSWEGMLQGRLSTRWQKVQECHERGRRQETASFQKRGGWSAQAVRLLCVFNSDLWHFRNAEVHGNTLHEAQQKLRAEVEDKVRRLYDRHPILLARYPSVRSIPLEVRLQKSTLALQMWLKHVDQQEKLTDVVRMKARMQEGSILRFLVPRSAVRVGVKNGCGQNNRLIRNAASKLVRWARCFLRFRSKVELPRAGIGDPG